VAAEGGEDTPVYRRRPGAALTRVDRQPVADAGEELLQARQRRARGRRFSDKQTSRWGQFLEVSRTWGEAQMCPLLNILQATMTSAWASISFADQVRPLRADDCGVSARRSPRAQCGHSRHDDPRVHRAKLGLDRLLDALLAVLLLVGRCTSERA
jgi:hypothetical protein